MNDNSSNWVRDSGSFRDPSGYVFIGTNRVLRTVNPSAADRYRYVKDSGVIEHLVEQGLLIGTREASVSNDEAIQLQGPRGEAPMLILEHPLVPFISYPYEWTFSQLKDSAIAHLDLQLSAIEFDVTLTDATPFNMQFLHGKPVHIDVLSLKPYLDGEPWQGYNQFCRMFLMPLLIEAWKGIPFQRLLRGSVDGIDLTEGAKLLPRTRLWTSINGILHIAAHARLIRSVNSVSSVKAVDQNKKLTRHRFRSLLAEIRSWVSRLESRRSSATYWSQYSTDNTYDADNANEKHEFVSNWAEKITGGTIWDIGGNSGDFSRTAIKAGVACSVVLDTDLDSLEVAYQKRGQHGEILPLFIDIADPTPSQGWNQRERAGLNERALPDGILALAVIHHLAIGRNLPLRGIVEWFATRAKTGVIEFVPKSDPMIKEMLIGREDIFADYAYDNFLKYLKQVSDVKTIHKLSDSERVLVEYSAHI